MQIALFAWSSLERRWPEGTLMRKHLLNTVDWQNGKRTLIDAAETSESFRRRLERVELKLPKNTILAEMDSTRDDLSCCDLS
ncbi:hypothetical protein CEXT_546171 [Caerostris extrusa]|uniref:Uncharacterized protein n=1 Tax=Caerostris extrusa TaxID=172846 RepID=A0AAV4S1Y9_CAEEX|nr:hypothetical protein CEXT_546171 [Caerostris extrusa]